jgi:hypothetical protein
MCFAEAGSRRRRGTGSRYRQTPTREIHSANTDQHGSWGTLFRVVPQRRSNRRTVFWRINREEEFPKNFRGQNFRGQFPGPVPQQNFQGLSLRKFPRPKFPGPVPQALHAPEKIGRAIRPVENCRTNKRMRCMFPAVAPHTQRYPEPSTRS